MVRNPLRRFPKEHKVDAGLLEVWKGWSILKRVDEISGENLKYRNAQNEEVEPYTGMLPSLLEIHPDILPIPWVFKKMWIRKRWRVRLHFKRFEEPLTRDLYTGEILDPEKKERVLKEKGVIDQEGYLLDFDGQRVSLWDDTLNRRVCLKIDVSDIDFIRAEYKALLDSKLVEKSADAMSKTGMKFDRNFYMLIGFFGLCLVLVVFIMSGGLGTLGL